MELELVCKISQLQWIDSNKKTVVMSIILRKDNSLMVRDMLVSLRNALDLNVNISVVNSIIEDIILYK